MLPYLLLTKFIISHAGGNEESPPVFYYDAINKGKFPDHIECLSPTRKIYISPGNGVNLKIEVKDQTQENIEPRQNQSPWIQQKFP